MRSPPSSLEGDGGYVQTYPRHIASRDASDKAFGVKFTQQGLPMTSLQLEPQHIPPVGKRALLRRLGHSVVIFNIDGQLHAIEDDCPHAGAALCTGKLSGHLIQCPAHGLRFDVRSGAMPGNPGMSLQVHPVREHEGGYVLELPGTPAATPASSS